VTNSLTLIPNVFVYFYSFSNILSIFFSITHIGHAYNFLASTLHRKKTKNLAPLRGIEPGIFFSGGGRDDHFATLPSAPEC
jgi:hypothetical protein